MATVTEALADIDGIDMGERPGVGAAALDVFENVEKHLLLDLSGQPRLVDLLLIYPQEKVNCEKILIKNNRI